MTVTPADLAHALIREMGPAGLPGLVVYPLTDLMTARTAKEASTAAIKFVTLVKKIPKHLRKELDATIRGGM